MASFSSCPILLLFKSQLDSLVMCGQFVVVSFGLEMANNIFCESTSKISLLPKFPIILKAKNVISHLNKKVNLIRKSFKSFLENVFQKYITYFAYKVF